MQPAHATDHLVPGPQIEMVGVRKQQGDVQVFERLLGHGLHGASCSHRHECRRFDGSVRRRQASQTRPGRIDLHNFKAKRHTRSLTARQLVSNCVWI